LAHLAQQLAHLTGQFATLIRQRRRQAALKPRGVTPVR
jgi:hypothetical protein